MKKIILVLLIAASGITVAQSAVFQVSTLCGTTPGIENGAFANAKFDLPVEIAYNSDGNKLYLFDREHTNLLRVVDISAGQVSEAVRLDGGVFGATINSMMMSKNNDTLFIARNKWIDPPSDAVGVFTLTKNGNFADPVKYSGAYTCNVLAVNPVTGELFGNSFIGAKVLRMNKSPKEDDFMFTVGTEGADEFRMTWSRDGKTLYTASYYNGAVWKSTYDTDTRQFVGAPEPWVGTYKQKGALEGYRTEARIQVPSNMATDNNGNLFICDRENRVVWKVDVDGNVKILAGQVGIAGSTDGTGNNALFNTPEAITVDCINNIIYVVDQGNSKIRKIIALATDARLSSLSIDLNNTTVSAPLVMFNADTHTYDYYLTKNHVIPTISANKMDIAASTLITQATNLSGTEEQKTASVEVTAADGITKITYKVRFIETDNIFISGNPIPTGAGWDKSQFTFSTTTFLTSGNNKFEGQYYVRAIGASTAGYLKLPVCTNIGELRFFAHKVDALVVGTLKVSAKIDAGTWTEIYNIGDISNYWYQEFVIPVNKAGVDSMFVRIDMTKNGDTYVSQGYRFDDFSYTGYTAPTINVISNGLSPFSTGVGVGLEKTIRVGGVNLSNTITVGLSGTDASLFSVTPSTMLQTDGKVGYTDVIVKYLPTSSGSHSAILTLSSAGASDLVYNLSGATLTTSLQNTSNNNITAYKNENNRIAIHFNEEMKSGYLVEVYNAMGQKLVSKQLVKNNELIEDVFASGLYLITLTRNGQVITKKVILN